MLSQSVFFGRKGKCTTSSKRLCHDPERQLQLTFVTKKAFYKTLQERDPGSLHAASQGSSAQRVHAGVFAGPNAASLSLRPPGHQHFCLFTADPQGGRRPRGRCPTGTEGDKTMGSTVMALAWMHTRLGHRPRLWARQAPCSPTACELFQGLERRQREHDSLCAVRLTEPRWPSCLWWRAVLVSVRSRVRSS